LKVKSVTKSFGAKTVLRDFSLNINEGEFLTILGESGSGKTTLLRLIAGFELPDQGEIWMGGERLDTLPPFRRRVNTVFQQYALFPHLSVFNNVAYGLRIAKLPPLAITERVNAALDMVKMSAYSGSKPSTISGGQQQRVALARALVNRPHLLLLDEPLSALDANLRSQMQSELKSLQREVGITFIFVTHDQQEAMAMSDRIALLRNGQLEQIAAPQEIYRQPTTTYVATFIGHSNILRSEVHAGLATCAPIQFPCSAPDGPAAFSLRPESIQIAKAVTSTGPAVRFRATIKDQSFQGATTTLNLQCASGLELTARISGQPILKAEEEFAFLPSDSIPVRDSEAH
jgi:spermidine/putrescine ABC transporter ATP-binding subunit